MDFRCATGPALAILIFGLPSSGHAVLFQEDFNGGTPSNYWISLSEAGGPQYNYQNGSFNLTGFSYTLGASATFRSLFPEMRRGATSYRLETRVMVPAPNEYFEVTFATGGGMGWGVPGESWPSIRMARIRGTGTGSMGLSFATGSYDFTPEIPVSSNTWFDLAVDITPATITGYLNGEQVYSGARNSGDSRIFGAAYEVSSNATNLHENNLRIDHIRFVPEPMSAVALGGSAAALLVSRRRKAKNRGC